MSEFTTIQLDKVIVEELKSIKQYPKETYREIITNMIKYIKTNYIFTVSNTMIEKVLFHLTTERKKELYLEIKAKLENLNQ